MKTCQLANPSSVNIHRFYFSLIISSVIPFMVTAAGQTVVLGVGPPTLAVLKINMVVIEKFVVQYRSRHSK